VTAPNGPGFGEDTRSVGEIVGDISKDLSAMVRSELELAKVEAKQELTKAGKGAGMFGGAALSGYFALLFLSLFVMYLLDNVINVEWAALIITVVWAIAAGALAAIGRKKMQEVNPALETTQKSLKEDVQWAKNQKR